MDFLDILGQRPKDTLKIYDDIILKEGEMVNIYGEPYSGKTLLCYWIMKNNPDKSVFYIDTESTPYPFLEKIGKEITLIYSQHKDINTLIDIITKSIQYIDYIIVDSVTAMIIEKSENKLFELLSVIKKYKKNLILVSQLREYNEQKFYEYKKLLNFFSYKAEVNMEGGTLVVNNCFVIDKKFLS